MKFCIDSMYGAGGTILSAIFWPHWRGQRPIRFNPDPLFPGINLSPLSPTSALSAKPPSQPLQAGLCTDGERPHWRDRRKRQLRDPHKFIPRCSVGF